MSLYFCISVYFKTSEKKTPIDPDKISEEIFQSLETNLFILKLALVEAGRPSNNQSIPDQEIIQMNATKYRNI